MGFIRGTLAFIFAAILLVSLIVLFIILTTSFSLEYENVKPQAVKAITNLKDSGIISLNFSKFYNKNKALIETQCSKKESLNVSSIIKEGPQEDNITKEFFGNNFIVPCATLKKGPNAILGYGITEAVDNIYYKDYKCSFIECFEKHTIPTFLISKQTRDYFSNNSKFFVFASVIISFLLFLVVENKQNAFLVVGILLIISAFPLLIISSILGSLPEEISPFTLIFFSQSNIVFWFAIVVGAVFITAGIFLKFFLHSDTKKKFSKNQVKKIIEKEISKLKKKKRKKRKRR